MSEFSEIWTYLAEGPLLWLAATLIAYSIGDALFKFSGRKPLVNPVLIAVVLVQMHVYQIHQLQHLNLVLLEQTYMYTAIL